MVGSSYWNIGIGREKGEVAGDEEGMGGMKALGENIGWLLKKLEKYIISNHFFKSYHIL